MKKVEEQLRAALKDFSPGGSVVFPRETLPNGAVMTTPLSAPYEVEEQIKEPWLVFATFVDLLGFDFSGRFEKVAWEIPVLYKNVSLLLSHHKFGFSVYFGTMEQNAAEVASEAYRKIRSVFSLTFKLVKPKIDDLFLAGRFTVENSSRSIYSRYLFFKSRARSRLVQPDDGSFSLKGVDDMKERVRLINKRMQEERSASYFSSAMADAFYSYIENILVLILPFLPNDPVSDIRTHIGARWTEKLKKVFDLSTSDELKMIYEELLEIKEQVRNPTSHGNFAKDGSNFFVHYPRLGAIPMELILGEKKPKYSMVRLQKPSFEKITSAFDRFLTYLKNDETTKYGYYYLRQGLPVFFDSDSRTTYRSHMKSGRTWKYYIERLSHEIDNATNMDW